MNVSEQYDDDEECNHNRPPLFPQEGGGVVDATLLKHITGFLMNNKDKNILYQRRVLDRSLSGDHQQLRMSTSRSLKACQQL